MWLLGTLYFEFLKIVFKSALQHVQSYPTAYVNLFKNQDTIETSIVRFSWYFKQGYGMGVIILIEQKAQVLKDFKW